MIALALESGITAVMKSYMYRFNDDIYLQKGGGPIGLELTGAIARVFMLWWDDQFMKRLQEATAQLDWNLYFYMRYVDDCNCIGEEIPLGARIHSGKVVIEAECIKGDRGCENSKNNARTSKHGP